MSVADLTLTVAQRTEAASGVVHLVLASSDGKALPAWEPGAHVDVVLTPTLVRQYSLCGDPTDGQRWEVAVLREPSGQGSAYVHESLSLGRPVRVRGPRNHFPLQPADDYLFIAGGIGITPILPMLAAATAAGASWRLVYGGRTLRFHGVCRCAHHPLSRPGGPGAAGQPWLDRPGCLAG